MTYVLLIGKIRRVIMLITLVGIQAVCVGVSTYMVLKTSRRADKIKPRLKLVSKDKATGFKYYKGGF